MSVQWSSTVPANYDAAVASSPAASNSSPAASPAPAPVAADIHRVNAASSANAVQSKQLTEADVQKVVDDLQKRAQTAAPNLLFSVDSDTSRFVVKVVDSSTKEVIRQFPSEELLHLGMEIDKMKGLLFNKKA
ncbi:MAG TPA: flagellar protein FlaG [Rhodocyclaceae bacterium]|jgi:flagellar protein FlaG